MSTNKRKRKQCNHPSGCNKDARPPTDYCKAHGGGKRCKHLECDKSARSPTDFCVIHGGGKRCKHLECNKSAIPPTDFCVIHGGGKRCKHLECDKAAQGSTDYCKAHGGGKRCKHLECDKSAISPTDYCKAHGGGKRCKHLECDKSAQGSTDFCVIHGGGKRCKHLECDKSARPPTDYCKAHGGGKRCKHLECDKAARPPTDFCVIHGGGIRCTCGLFSVSRKGFLCYTCRKGTERMKQFEHMVQTYLEKFNDLKHFSYRDQVLPCAPTRRRGDFVYILHDRIVILEVDEHAHERYNKDCECVRVLELHEQAQGMSLFLLRFNPIKRLLPEMAIMLRRCFQNILPDTLLDVKFIGYSSEYDVVKECVRIAKERCIS
jgi:hypothetical protein